MYKKNFAIYFAAVSGIAAMMMTGCGSGDVAGDVAKSINKYHVQQVANTYSAFQYRHAPEGFRGPKDADELIAFLKDPSMESALKKMGIEDIEGMFIGDRDNEEIKVRWGISGGTMGCPQPLAFEAVGVNGVRIVAFGNQRYDEVDNAAQYDKWLAGEYTPPAARGNAEMREYDEDGNLVE